MSFVLPFSLPVVVSPDGKAPADSDASWRCRRRRLLIVRQVYGVAVELAKRTKGITKIDDSSETLEVGSETAVKDPIGIYGRIRGLARSDTGARD
jgi:hypothetical protein